MERKEEPLGLPFWYWPLIHCHQNLDKERADRHQVVWLWVQLYAMVCRKWFLQDRWDLVDTIQAESWEWKLG
jgi:hypothetical protein